MDESRQHLEVVGLPEQGPPGRSHYRKHVPSDFTPLRLVLQDAAGAIELTAPDMVLGRHSSSDIRLPLPDVSRRHCRFVFTAGHWQVIDLQSLNGVWVNDQPVQRSPLHAGDRLRIGELVFTVSQPGQTETAGDAAAMPSLYDLFRASMGQPQAVPMPRRRAG